MAEIKYFHENKIELARALLNSGSIPEESRKGGVYMTEGIGIGDLIGGLEEVEVVDAQNTEKEGNQILVVEAKDANGEQVDSIGFFGKETIESALNKGRKENGRVLIKVPKKNVSKGLKRVNWVSDPY